MLSGHCFCVNYHISKTKKPGSVYCRIVHSLLCLLFEDIMEEFKKNTTFTPSDSGLREIWQLLASSCQFIFLNLRIV